MIKKASKAAGSGILSTVEPGGVGKGGNIDINASTLSLVDGAQLITSIRGDQSTQQPNKTSFTLPHRSSECTTLDCDESWVPQSLHPTYM